MAGPAGKSNTDDALNRLLAGRDGLPWEERRALLAGLRRTGFEGIKAARLTELFDALVNDPEPAVRKELAELLVYLPDDEFIGRAARLSGDTNAFVRDAAGRAIERRRRGREAEERRRRLDPVAEMLEDIERVHGPAAAEKAEQMAERLYDVRMGAAVHDLRGLLTPALSQAETLYSQNGKSARKADGKTAAKLLHRLALMERLVEDIRDYSQSAPPERHRERLADLVQEANAVVREGLAARSKEVARITVEIEVPPALGAEVARTQMLTVLVNVLKNAHESFAEGPTRFRTGTIRLTARATDDGLIEIAVADNGMGMSEDELEVIRRFVPGGTSKKRDGSGYGLPIARRSRK
jgi:signal transduction histidine kinase